MLNNDLVGKKFDRLKVLSLSHYDKIKRQRFWNCECECGKTIIRKTYSLTSKKGIKSCGCYTKEINTKRFLENNPLKTHGMYGTRIHKIFRKMTERCYSKNYPEKHLYSERGITICDEWKDNFNAFYEWSMQNGYQDNLSIDRIDNNLGYSPQNCRWADKYQQANNKRNNVVIEHNGMTKTLAEWAKYLGLTYATLQNRRRKGKSIEEILNPIKKR